MLFRSIYVSDQTLNGDRTLYPALNEQGGLGVTGLWSLDPNTSKLALIDHSPSGSPSHLSTATGAWCSRDGITCSGMPRRR